VSFMNDSDSAGALRFGHGGLVGWIAGKAETGLSVLYALFVILMLGIYFINPPEERSRFYRATFAEWRSAVESVYHTAKSRALPNLAAARLMIPVGQAVIGYLDQAEGEPVIRVAGASDVRVSGWAGCSKASSHVARVAVLVDNRTEGTAMLSLPRPDVAEAFGRADFDNSGWSASFPAQHLGPGSHQLTARVTCTSGESATLPAFRLIVREK
jgi:hypothetical protein